ncbi:MAG: prepilin-type N-terminal cleavage/methylation domain-containing protein, partial [Gemmatimonadetes bacterium]|nr:prepilin-type N-terminal cleavage/methylation domain-containing protein [Gemmatimonadota bacterium]
MHPLGGVMTRRGFTLIEIIVV